MSETQNSISSVIEQFLRLNNNALEIVSKLAEATTSSNESIELKLTDDNNVSKSQSILSFGFIKSELNRLEENQKQLAGLGDTKSTLRMPDGSLKKIFESSILKDPKALTALQVPSEFKIKNNWFFESFLNPLLFISFDVTSLVDNDMERAVVKRVILELDTLAKEEWFNTNIKGKNDIVYKKLFADLSANDIAFFVDEETVDLPLSVMRYKGSFDVLRIFDEVTDQIINGKTVVLKKRKYKLNKLTYTDAFTTVTDSKNLQINDVLVVNNSQYKIESIDAGDNSIVVKKISGFDPIKIGVDSLSISGNPFSVKQINVNVGHDERQVIFIKAVDSTFNVVASEWSPGTGVYTNELTITTTSGVTTLDSFYKSQVVDFGMQFLNSAKEKSIPSVFGETPNIPSLDVNNFKVLTVNSHKKDTKEIDAIKKKLASKVELENKIKQLEESINNKKNELNNSSQRSPSERKKLKADFEGLAKDKSNQVNLYSSLIKELSTKLKENPVIAAGDKFRVRGFWPIPEPKSSDKTKEQEVIQFKVAYRYLKKDGNTTGTEQLTFKDVDGSEKKGYFSNWIEYKSEIRKKEFDSTTGFYTWADENTSDPDANNINQLDISISSGEKVEIKIKSISEAGWPINPIESEWSPSIIVDFPEDLQINDATFTLLQEAANEESRVKFQDELNGRGLDLHLLSSFTSGDKYFAHDAADVASGFFTDNGAIISLFEKVKSLDIELQRIKQIIEKAKGTLVVFLIDEEGNVTKITPNSTTKLFGGFYKDLIKSGSGSSITYDHGKIITKNYTIRIENSAATPLELASYLPGGTGEAAPTTLQLTTSDYGNRKYNLIPLSISGINSAAPSSLKHVAPFQSSQVKSQFIYMRYKSVGLDEDLYNSTSAPVSGYAHATPDNGWHLLPTNSALFGGAVNVDVWNGLATNVGGGKISEFCIHKDHPEASGTFAAHTGIKPTITVSSQGYPRFIHSQLFDLSITETNGTKQLEQSPYTVWSSGTIDFINYPAKLGFYKNDEFLIGKKTCGSYLYLSATDYTSINVDGSNELAKRLLEFGEEKGINIPLVFQFRCSDKIGKIGGYRTAGDVTNITYTKKVGIDIQIRNEAPFSFDIEVSAKYEQDSLTQPVYIPNNALNRLNDIRTMNTNTSAR